MDFYYISFSDTYYYGVATVKERDMGQRLNIEIINNGKTLANAYYHWAAYSNSAAELAQMIIRNVDSVNKYQSDLLKAIKLLELTGAGLTDREIEYAKTIDELKEVELKECTGRNDGLIAISPEGISETRFWQEYSLYIYLDEQRMNFKVLWDEPRWDYERDCKEDDTIVQFNDLEVFDINLDDIKFSEIDSFVDFIESHLHGYFRLNIDPSVVYAAIY